MCERCTGGSLGYSPDGEWLFCDCGDGLAAALDNSSRLINLYAEQLAVFDRHSPIIFPTMKGMRKEIQDAYNRECSAHDLLEGKLEGMTR